MSGGESGTASLLDDGRVLITGGIGNRDTTELYDPSSGTWSMGPVMTEARHIHSATVLKNGKVLIAGGQGIERLSNTAEVFTP